MHRCKCSPDCRMGVETKGKKFARGHAPNSGFKLGSPSWRKGLGAICTVPDCGKRVHGQGLCPKHRHRFIVHGSPFVEVSKGHPKGVPLTRAHKKNLSIAHSNNGYKHSEETKKQMSVSMRLGYANGRLLASTATLRNNVSGDYKSKKMNVVCHYRSKLEKRFMVLLDKSKQVKFWFFEPFTIPYWFRGKAHTYFLDFAVWYKNNKVKFIEVKHSSHLTQERVVSKRAAAEIFAKQAGAEYRFFTEREVVVV